MPQQYPSDGAVAALWRYPVKSMIGEEVEAADVTPRGLLGDRSYALLDTTSGNIASAKSPRKFGRLFDFRAGFVEAPQPDAELPPARITFPDGSSATTRDGDIHARLSAVLGREVRLVSAPPTGAKYESLPVATVSEGASDPLVDYPLINGFFDVGAVHLVSTGTLEHLQSLYRRGASRCSGSGRTSWCARRRARPGSWRTAGSARRWPSARRCGCASFRPPSGA